MCIYPKPWVQQSSSSDPVQAGMPPTVALPISESECDRKDATPDQTSLEMASEALEGDGLAGTLCVHQACDLFQRSHGSSANACAADRRACVGKEAGVPQVP